MPTSLDDFLAPEWKGKLAMASFEARTSRATAWPTARTRWSKLIDDLKANDLTLTDDPGSLLSSGDKAANLATQLYNPNPALKPAPFEDANTYVQFSRHQQGRQEQVRGAMLFELWNAYDPDWLTMRLTDEKFASSALPYPGLPSSTFDQSKGLIKANQDAWFVRDRQGLGDLRDPGRTATSSTTSSSAANDALNK